MTSVRDDIKDLQTMLEATVRILVKYMERENELKKQVIELLEKRDVAQQSNKSEPTAQGRQVFSFKCRDGARITGLREVVECIAGVSGFTKDGAPIYDGKNEVDWNSQRPMTWNNDGTSLMYVDDNGESWHSVDLKHLEYDGD